MSDGPVHISVVHGQAGHSHCSYSPSSSSDKGTSLTAGNHGGKHMLLSQQSHGSHPSSPRRTHPPRAEAPLRKGYHRLFSTEATTAEQWEQSLGSVQCLQRQRSSPMRWDQSKSPGSSIFHQSIITSTRYAPHKILQEPHCLARTLDTYVPLLRVQTTEKVQQSWKVKCI